MVAGGFPNFKMLNDPRVQMQSVDAMLSGSRHAIKKYILANNKTAAATSAVFDAQFNKALRSGVEKGEFSQPKGTCLLTR